jgi:amyloid beta precursor protein binding protein 1
MGINKHLICSQHDGNAPKTYAEKQEFKKAILAMKVKQDEENFDEAEAQAYRCWSESKVYLLYSSISSCSYLKPNFFPP